MIFGTITYVKRIITNMNRAEVIKECEKSQHNVTIIMLYWKPGCNNATLVTQTMAFKSFKTMNHPNDDF